jgi:hypothetical protein
MKTKEISQKGKGSIDYGCWRFMVGSLLVVVVVVLIYD